jgi:hypothetical protein
LGNADTVHAALDDRMLEVERLNEADLHGFTSDFIAADR